MKVMLRSDQEIIDVLEELGDDSLLDFSTRKILTTVLSTVPESRIIEVAMDTNDYFHYEYEEGALFMFNMDCLDGTEKGIYGVTIPMPDTDAINPSHYRDVEDEAYETIKVIEAWGLDMDFLLGNTVKYISRCGKKDAPLQELKKAKWYLDRKIKNLEREQS